MIRVPRLLAITDRRSLDRPLADWLDELAAAGVDGVALREKDLDDRGLFELAKDARRRFTGLLVVNGRADVALAAGCDGVHLPAAGLPTAALRRRLGPGPVIGRSTHDPAEVSAAARDGADYVTFGPVYPTPSKAAYGPPPGVSGLRRAAAAGLPVLALGGVDGARWAEVRRAGASGMAGIRVFQDKTALEKLVAASRDNR